MTEINYNFGANASSLEDVNSRIQDIHEVRSDIAGLFQTLASVYEGDGAQALQVAHQKIDSMLEEALNNTANTQRQAQEQQEAMQALDRANAAAF
ncbi:hypothetical protein [Mycolicibacterium smegmatis]|uniref:hypothetical protein n=1 Tax=Mycolicibacterium smegmatis TaxID=1772 RepID=UPI001303CFBD|nr:hypothetical protein [Mycolicibacterium smegmatis]